MATYQDEHNIYIRYTYLGSGIKTNMGFPISVADYEKLSLSTAILWSFLVYFIFTAIVESVVLFFKSRNADAKPFKDELLNPITAAMFTLSPIIMLSIHAIMALLVHGSPVNPKYLAPILGLIEALKPNTGKPVPPKDAKTGSKEITDPK